VKQIYRSVGQHGLDNQGRRGGQGMGVFGGPAKN
jgi:hypothetical protein